MTDSNSPPPEQRFALLRRVLPDLALTAAGLCMLGWLMAASFALAADAHGSSRGHGHAAVVRTATHSGAAKFGATPSDYEPGFGPCADAGAE